MHQRPPRHGWGTENTRQFVSRRASRRSQDKKKKKKRRLTKRRTTTTREERCGRRARRTRRDAAGGTHVDGKRQAVFARGLLLSHAHADRGLRAGGLRRVRGGHRGARHRDDLFSFTGIYVTSVPACPPSPFAFAFDLFERVAPTSTSRVGSTRRRSCAARVPPRADECGHEGCAR